MATPISARRVLFPLYAFNVEVARAPWVTQEPMIAEMRLQWWRDALDEIANGGRVRRHDIVDGLAGILDVEGARALDRSVAARRWDIYSDPFDDAAHLDEYIDATSGTLMATGARLLGPCDEAIVSDFAYATGIANLFKAAPELEARGRKPLVDGTRQGIMTLAERAGARLAEARKGRRSVSKLSGAAMLSGWATKPILKQAMKTPDRLGNGTLRAGPLRLTWVAVAGWWR